MKKADRQKVFDKYGGKCAYCGCDLQKGWHVDEIKPVFRKRKLVGGHFTERGNLDSEWVERKSVPDGCMFPDHFHIDNQNPACASCNMMKSTFSIEGFRGLIEGFINSLNQYQSIYRFAKKYNLINETGQKVVFYFETFNIPHP